MQQRRFHSQNAGFEMSAPIGIGVEILAGGDVSLNRRSLESSSRTRWASDSMSSFSRFRFRFLGWMWKGSRALSP
jgi:hypothetical protein